MITIEFLLQILLVGGLSYFVGSIPTAYVIARVRNVNVFEVGSGNMGGTNIARSMGLRWGILTVALDMLKGLFAVWLSISILQNAKVAASIVGGIAAIAGHNWSITASILHQRQTKGRFVLRGGKGASTAFGTMWLIMPPVLLIAMTILCIALILITRYVSFAVLSSYTMSTVWVTILVMQEAISAQYIIYMLFILALILWRFRENIDRLLHGTERRLGERVEAEAQ